jgi:hypothetical protein
VTDGKIALHELLEKSSDATFLREMIGFAAERLMALETENLCGAIDCDGRNGRQVTLTRKMTASSGWPPARVAGMTSEWWPASNRNDGGHQVEIGGWLASEISSCVKLDLLRAELFKAA